jgi:hypothetical protein
VIIVNANQNPIKIIEDHCRKTEKPQRLSDQNKRYTRKTIHWNSKTTYKENAVEDNHNKSVTIFCTGAELKKLLSGILNFRIEIMKAIIKNEGWTRTVSSPP